MLVAALPLKNIHPNPSKIFYHQKPEVITIHIYKISDAAEKVAKSSMIDAASNRKQTKERDVQVAIDDMG